MRPIHVASACTAVLSLLCTTANAALPPPKNVGYYEMCAGAGAAYQVAPITAVGQTPVLLDDLTGADLAGIDVLFVTNCDNGGYGGEYQSRLSDIATFVSNGGVLLIHDRYVDGASSILPGGDSFTIIRSFVDDANINVLDDSTILTHGWAGDVTNTNLDGGNSSSHGFAIAGTLPGDADLFLSQADPTHIVTFSYGFGAGKVLYSSIPLDFYLAGNNPPKAIASIYAPNVIAWAAGLPPPTFDFGDAPAPYPTLRADDGAHHIFTGSGPILGSAIDDETDGQPNAAANGDQGDDGVTILIHADGGSPGIAQVVVSGAPGKLDGWIDFNQDGDWNDAGEKIFNSVPVNVGTQNLTFSVPAPTPTLSGPIYARFRISTAGGLGPTGFARDGEVEDYVLNAIGGSSAAGGTSSNGAGGGTEGSAVVVGGGALPLGTLAGLLLIWGGRKRQRR
ncbi:MAG TPA: GEVED domain-containing protein [Nevskiaceae bacterium]|nr:GEVED domain-containing protein [Nevskiaceae bacterium]